MEEGRVFVSSEQNHHDFYRRPSLAGITTLTLNLRDDTWYNALAKRFNEWAREMKKEDFSLERIQLQHVGSLIEVPGLEMLIIAIGRLKCRTRLFMSFFVSNMNMLDWGNITELYFYHNICVGHIQMDAVIGILSLTRI